MPANIEIKAKVHDLNGLHSRASALSDSPVQIIQQEDTFFNTPRGRLKLRKLMVDSGQLVFYERPDQEGPKRSTYLLAATSQPEALKITLAAALGVRGVVRKTRHLYMVGQSRIHVDEVDGLGNFMELEVVLEANQSDTEGQTIAEDLMEKLGIDPADLLEGAYLDYLEKK